MKKLLSLVALVTLLAGVSFAEGASLPVEGSWGTSFQNNGFTFDITMKLQNQQMTTTNVCKAPDGRSAVASVTVPANYDASTITVLGTAEQHVSQNGLDCNVSVKPDRMNYQIAGSALILTHEGQNDQFVLTRR